MNIEEQVELDDIYGKLVGLNVFLEGHSDMNIRDILKQVQDLRESSLKTAKEKEK